VKRLALLLMLLLPGLARAQTIQYLGMQSYTFTATGPYVTINTTGSGIGWHQLTWTKVGTINTCQIKLQQSPDGTTWSDLIAATTCTSNGQSAATNVVATYVRMNMTVLSGGGSVTVVWTGYANNPAGGGGAGSCTPPGSVTNGILYDSGSGNCGDASFAFSSDTITSPTNGTITPPVGGTLQIGSTGTIILHGGATSVINITDVANTIFATTAGGRSSLDYTDIGANATFTGALKFTGTSVTLGTAPAATGQTLIYDGTNASFAYVGTPVNPNSETTCSGGNLNIVDRKAYILCSGGTTATFTLPVHSTTGFGNNFPFLIKNANSGLLTITPTTDTIDGGSSQTIPPGWSAFVFQDGSGNWKTVRFPSDSAPLSCSEVWGGSGTSFAMQSGDDAIVRNGCVNDSGATRIITAVKCRSDNAANTTTVNPTFGSDGTGTTILSGALTCGNSYAYSASGTVSNGSWTTGTGIAPGMATVGNATSIALIVEYHY